MRSVNKNTSARVSLATFEDDRNGINVSGTQKGKRGGIKRKGRLLDLLATISMK